MTDFVTTVWEGFIAIGYIEWFAVVTGAVCIYLATKENILSWPISLLSIIAYIYIFYNAKLYGDTILQFYFLFTAVYGWHYWSHGKNGITSERPITTLTNANWVFIILLVVVLTVVAGFLLNEFTDTDVAYIDGFCTVSSFVAQFLMTRKKLENWLLWIVTDLVFIPLYIYKELYATAVLYLLFTFIAAQGYIEWKKKVKRNLSES